MHQLLDSIKPAIKAMDELPETERNALLAIEWERLTVGLTPAFALARTTDEPDKRVAHAIVKLATKWLQPKYQAVFMLKAINATNKLSNNWYEIRVRTMNDLTCLLATQTFAVKNLENADNE